MYFAFDGLFHVQIADAAKMTAKSQRALIAQPSAARACSLSASSTCLGRRSFSCFMATSSSLSLLIGLKEMRPALRRAAFEAIKYFIGVAFAKRRSIYAAPCGCLRWRRSGPMTLAVRLWPLIIKWPRLCAFAPLREIGFLVQAAVLAKAPRRKGREGRRAC